MVSKSAKEKERFGYDGTFQLRLLRTLYQDPNFTISLCDHLSHEHFEKRIHRWFAERMLSYAREHVHGIPADALKIEAERAYRTGRLQRKRDKKAVDGFISRLDRKVKDRSYIKDEVFRFVKNQTIKDAILNGVDHLKEGNYDAIDTDFQGVLDVQMAVDGGFGHFMYGDRTKRFKERLHYEPNGIPSGIGFDKFMKPNGLPPGEFGVIAAPPGGGKTATLVHIGRHGVHHGVQVLHVTLELSERVIQDRYDAAFTQIPIHALEQEGNPKRIRRHWKRLGDEEFDGGEPLLIKEMPAGCKTSDIRRHLRHLERVGFYPGLLLVDYPDLMQSDKESETWQKEEGNVYVELRQLCRDTNMAGWGACQGKKESLNKEIITMKDLAGSFDKPKHADFMAALCQTEKEKPRKLARFFVIKNREGVADVQVNVKLDWSRPNIINR